MINEEAKQRAKNYMSLKGALEPNQIKCYCGHTSYCDCIPLDESKQETIKAREVESSIVKQLLDETTPEELNKIDKQMSNQTAVNWLIQTLESDIKVDESNMVNIRIHEHDYIKSKQVALEMEKEQIMNSWALGVTSDDNMTAEQYYNEQYVSKESNDHIGDANEMIKISDESWEGCDGCTEQDEIMYKNGYVKGYNAAVSELPKEISDEEIIKLANEHILYNDSKRQWVIEGMKLYKKQLKNKYYER